MSDEDPIKAAKDGVSVVSEIIKAAGDSPEAKEAAKNLGKTAVTLTKTINNALMPLAAINFAFDKAREYFANHFQSDLAEKAVTIPLEHIVEPKASVAGPSLQGLAFTHQEPTLKEMYLNLLATAMDGRVAEDAHPAFVEIIKQLNGNEAALIREVLTSPGPIAIIQIQCRLNESGGHHVLLRHVLNMRNNTTQQPVENPRLAAMIDNWIRLGLVDVSYDTYLRDPNQYSWAEQRPEFIRLRNTHSNDTQKVEFAKGYIARTELGKQFAKAIGMITP
ncbi:MAG TPA: DUF4393 domain-containing protein [Paucimonas sp.]|nr:DUF4393 domain-containing protein [Paucimonas sp.]